MRACRAIPIPIASPGTFAITEHYYTKRVLQALSDNRQISCLLFFFFIFFIASNHFILNLCEAWKNIQLLDGVYLDASMR